MAQSIDPSLVIGFEFPESVYKYDQRDAIIYALGIGLGRDPVDKNELKYLYEGFRGGFRVFPTFSANFSFGFLPSLDQIPGLIFEPMMLLHGEHRMEMYHRLPVEGKIINRAKISEVYDKGSGALVMVDVTSVDGAGQKLAFNQFRVFIRGIGGFGGNQGPPSNKFIFPEREPDFVDQIVTLPQQAILYRLSGDKNPLHIDPDRAVVGGFERPILHGLCTFGMAAKAIVGKALDFEPDSLKSIRARFLKHVFPGETLRTEIWMGDGDNAKFRVVCLDRDEIVLSNGFVEFE